jgi:phospho-2-dehydro-3-deoxyheptonate aldolase
MVESHLVAGRQDHVQGTPVENLTYGQSVTDACIGWDDSWRAGNAGQRREAAPPGDGSGN